MWARLALKFFKYFRQCGVSHFASVVKDLHHSRLVQKGGTKLIDRTKTFVRWFPIRSKLFLRFDPNIVFVINKNRYSSINDSVQMFLDHIEIGGFSFRLWKYGDNNRFSLGSDVIHKISLNRSLKLIGIQWTAGSWWEVLSHSNC